MSTLETPYTVEHTNAPDGSHKFHLELSVTDTQIRNAEYAAGAKARSNHPRFVQFEKG
jgi:hypothetical protein